MITAIFAMDRKRCIGREGKLPRHFTEDLQFFKRMTKSGIVIMGRRTFQSIGKPLLDRINFVVSSTMQSAEWYIVCNSVWSTLDYIKNNQIIGDIFIIWWAGLYQECLSMNIVDEIYCTLVEGSFSGDIFMPSFENNFREVSEVVCTDIDKLTWKEYRLRFVHYLRKI